MGHLEDRTDEERINEQVERRVRTFMEKQAAADTAKVNVNVLTSHARAYNNVLGPGVATKYVEEVPKSFNFRQIDAQTSELEKVIDTLAQVVSDLEMRLEGVCMPEMTNATQDMPQVLDRPMVAYAFRINSSKNQVAMIAGKISNLLDRLEI